MAILVTFMTVAVLCTSAAFHCAVALVQSDDQVITRILGIYLGIWIVFFIYFNTLNPTYSVHMLAYLFYML